MENKIKSSVASSTTNIRTQWTQNVTRNDLLRDVDLVRIFTNAEDRGLGTCPLNFIQSRMIAITAMIGRWARCRRHGARELLHFSLSD